MWHTILDWWLRHTREPDSALSALRVERDLELGEEDGQAWRCGRWAGGGRARPPKNLHKPRDDRPRPLYRVGTLHALTLQQPHAGNAHMEKEPMQYGKWRHLIFWMSVVASYPAALSAQVVNEGEPCFFEAECAQGHYCDTFNAPDTSLFNDAFDGDKLSEDWTIRGLLAQGSQADWTISDKTLVEYAGVLDASGSDVTERLGSLATFGEGTWSNYEVSATLNASQNSEIGLVFYDNGTSFYLFSIDTEMGTARLMRYTGDSFKRLSDDIPISNAVPGWWNFFHVSVHDAVIKASINGQGVFDVFDNELSSGKAGAYAWGQPGARFDDFHVRALPAPIGVCAVEQTSCVDSRDCSMDQVCGPGGQCLEQVLDYHPVWEIYSGEAYGALSFLGGFENLAQLFPAPAPMFTHSGLMGVPPIGHSSWSSVELDAINTLVARPISAHEIDGHVLRQRLTECGITPFPKEALPEHPDPAINSLAHALMDIGEWIVLGELGQVWALVNLRGAQVTWIQVSALEQKATTEGVFFTQTSPMTDLGFFLHNLNCNL